ncbi:MAG: transporter ATP-binding protein [Aeromicrobium sp.]|nr:transporter ATP-binding protein [Aeromicrobium sp.]
MTFDELRPVVRASSASFRLGRSDVLQSVDAEIVAGSQSAMTGRSGSGKTTLLLAFAGLIAPTSGTIDWPGLSTCEVQRREQIGMVFQAPSLMPELTALQNVTLPLRLRGIGIDEADERARVAMAEVNAADLRDAFGHELSGGQQQRVAIARVLAGRYRLVLADEPTGALDRAHALDVVRALRDSVAAFRGTLVLATHDLEISSMFDSHLMIDRGQLTGVSS